MSLLLLKLVATPLLILAASLAGRRWGETVSGWFVGLPLTSAPVCFFLAVEQGPGFAATAALGCLSGAAAEAGFALAYAVAAQYAAWPLALAAGSIAFTAAASLFALTAPPLLPLTLGAAAALAGGLAVLPHHAGGPLTVAAPRRWDIPARMAVATVLVVGLTELAPLLGATLSGLLATFPVFAAVLAAFAHHARGAAAATGVLRGLLAGLFAFVGFFAVLPPALAQFGIAAAFVAATFVALAIQGMSLAVLRR